MGRKLVFGVLVIFASLGVAAAAIVGYEWWQNRNLGSRVTVAPTTPMDSAPTTIGDPVTTAFEAPLLTEVDAQSEDAVVEGAPREDRVAPLLTEVDTRSEIEAVAPSAPEPAVTTTTLHPQVQAQGMERVVAIIKRHSDAWPWVLPALDVAQLSFFENLPSVCDSANGCYNHATGDIWLSLDALRERDTTSFSYFLDDRGPSDTVLHELAHAYTRSFPEGSELLNLFGRHYAGCSSRGLDTDRLVAELLADTMAMAATRAGSSLPSDYGYFDSGGFAGCLVESSEPDEALFGAVYSTLFNCDSEHALSVYENHHDPLHIGPLFGNDADADAVLINCYGIDCITTSRTLFAPNRGCENVTESDERRDAADERLSERRCADGLLHAGSMFEQPGWEASCESFVPDDVECIVTESGYKPGEAPLLPGVLDVSGECIVPNCIAAGAQGEPQPGQREFLGECIPIDRLASDNIGTTG